MIRELLQRYAALTDPQLHLVYLGLQAAVAALLVLATLLAVLRRGTGGWVVRLISSAAALLSSLALVVGFDGVPLDPYGATSLGIPLRWFVGFTAATALTIAMTAASARTGLLVAVAHAMASLGLLIYLVLLTAVPAGADPTWEVQRFADFVTFVSTGTLGVLAAGYASARGHGIPTRLLYGATALAGVVAVAVGLGSHPRPGLATWVLASAPIVGAAAALLWIARKRTTRPFPVTRATMRRVGTTLLVLSPVAVAGAALVLGGSGSARDVSRISLLGLEITPGLIVPFLFAPALGVVLGSRRGGKRSVWLALALTVALAGLLMAQKEVGNTAVVLAVAAVAFLVVRGTLPHLLAAGGLAAAGVALAYHLAPVIAAIPFTFRERIHLWLGGADLVRRGGHLVAASHVTYDVGGFWGIGIHSTPGLNLPRTVVALDTDFPLAIVGLYGGMILLAVYVALFVCFGLLLLDTVRRLGFSGDTLRARRHAAILSGLAAVPITSTAINLAGAITHMTPFTGVPVIFASYGAIFILGTYAIIAVFVLASNRDPLRALVKRQAERALRERATEALPSAARRSDALGVHPGGRATEPPAAADPHGRPAVGLWRVGRWLELARLRTLFRTLRRGMRFRTLQGGLAIMMLGLPAIGVAFGARLYDRYTDTARLFGHPRVRSELRVEPTSEGDTRWAVTDGPVEATRGPLAEDERLRLDSLVLRYRQGRLQVRGACFPVEQWKEGVSFGFSGMLDAPPLPVLDRLVAPVLSRLPSAPPTNDVVIPQGDITLRHAMVTRTGIDTFAVRALSPAATVWLTDEAGEEWSPWVAGDVRLGQGFTIGVVEPRRFLLDEERGTNEICAELDDGALFEYALSPLGPTVLGGTALLQRNMGRSTVDFELAEAIKAAGETGLLYADPRRGLVVAPHSPEDRAQWDEARAKLFRRVFQVVRIRTEDGGEREALAWSRPFYRDGSRGFQPKKELDAFIVDGDRVLGLADSFRFSQVLPSGHGGIDPRRLGGVYDRGGSPLTRLDLGKRRILPTVQGTGALIGVSYEDRAIRDGLLRIFAPLLRGPDPLPDPEAELSDLLRGEWRGPWGWDVFLTLDGDIQRRTFDAVALEIGVLDAREKDVAHHAQAIVLGPRNEILAVAQLPDAGLPSDLESFIDLRERQRTHPMSAPALDAFHRQTTMGSTVKLLTTIAAFRDKRGTIFLDHGQWYIDARGDASYGVKGRYADRGGSLSSWKGKGIVPLSNYGHKSYGRVVSMHDMIVHSVNTAAAYLGMNVGLDRFLALFDDTGMRGAEDLLPPGLTDPHGLGYLLDRHAKDAATLLPAAVAVIPSNEQWMLSYTARLPLSGMSDYTILKLAAGASIIARDGEYHRPTLVKAVRSRKTGQTTSFASPAAVRVISPEDAETINSYMIDVVRRGTAASLRWRWGLAKDVWLDLAGKTGTGETVKPVKRGAVYDRKAKPKTRDNKAFIGFWPASSPEPFVVAVVFEEVSHLDTRVAIRTVQRIVEGIVESREGKASKGAPSSARAGGGLQDVRVVAVEDLPLTVGVPGGSRP